MPRASKVRVEKEKLKELTDHFSYLISSLNSSSEIENFLNNFLSEEEKIMLTKRLVLFMMIQRNYPPHVIKDSLHVSHETIRIYKDKLPSKNEAFRRTIERLLKREKTQEFWKKIDQLLKPFELAMRAKTDMRARARLLSS